MRQFFIAAFILLLATSTFAQDSAKVVPEMFVRDYALHERDSASHIPLGPVHTFSHQQSFIGLSPLLGDSYADNTIQLDIDFHMNSNAMFTTFAGAFLSQKDITPSMITRVLGFTKKDIKYEDELKAGLAYKHYFKKHDVTFYASYYHRNLRSLTTSHDAFQLIFEGNKPFEDKTASLSDISFQDLMYNQYSLGASKSFGHFFIGINASYLQGFTDQQIKNPSGSLYTAPYGEYLDVAYNLTFNEATPGASHFFDLNGQGFSGDLQLGYNSEKSRFSFTIQDFGFIKWNKHPISYRGDTALTFNGIVINDITNIAGSGLSGINIDSAISALSPKKSTRSYNTFLPATFQATFSQLISLRKHDMILTVGLNTRLLTGYYAYGYVKSTFLLNHNWSTSVSGGAGGYSLFNLGWDVGKSWKNLDFLIGTNNLIGCVVPMYYPGSSFYVRIAAHF